MARRSVTLAQLRAEILDQADMTGSDFITTARLDNWINKELSELYDLIVSAFSDHFVLTTELTTVSGQEWVLMPDDVYKIIQVFYKDSSGSRWKLKKFMAGEIHRLSDDFRSVYDAPKCSMYRWIGNKMYFLPEPTEAGTIELWYIPHLTELVNDTDSISLQIPVGWEDYVVCGVASRCLIKEESDPTPLLARKAAITQRIEDMAANRDEGEPDRVVDSRDHDDWDLW